MFAIVLKPEAVDALRRIKRVHARAIMDTMERLLEFEPERVSRSAIKRLRGKQRATYRLRVGDYRVFYDVAPGVVTIVAVLHKSQTLSFYSSEEDP